MKILDKYVIRQFLQTILFGLIAFLFIFVVVDLMENLDDFIDQDMSFFQILHYYFVFTPEIIRLMLPVAVFLSCIFTVGKLTNQNELAAVKAGGVSLYRFMSPFVITAFLISIFAIFFGGFTVPAANKEKVFIERNYMKKAVAVTGSNILFQDNFTRIVSVANYNTKSRTAYTIGIQEFDPADNTRMMSRIDASKMKYDSTGRKWILHNAITRNFIGDRQTETRNTTLEIDYLNFLPDDILKKQRKPEEMNLLELTEFAQEQLDTGNNPTRIRIAYHSRIAFAFASLVVVLFGVPFSANKRRGGLALQIGISLLITFLYLVFMNISQAFGKNGVMNPILTAWFANFVFISAGIINLIQVRK